VLVRIRTDNGLEGIGEADSKPEVVKAIIDAGYSHNIACGLRSLLIGENPLNMSTIWQKMLRGTMYFGRSSVTISAMAAIDMALWDLKGKCFDLPVYQLLGGRYHDKIQAYAPCLFGRDGRETRDIAKHWSNVGYEAIKFGWEPMGPDLKVDLDLVRGAREGIGDGLLMVDAGCVWDARTALQRANAFHKYGLTWLEEPLRSNDIDGYKWLRDRFPIPIAGGEQECGRESWRPLIDQHALDVYQVDLARNGFTESDYIRQRVEEIGARLCNHCYTSSLTVSACLHWLVSCRDAFVFEDCCADVQAGDVYELGISGGLLRAVSASPQQSCSGAIPDHGPGKHFHNSLPDVDRCRRNGKESLAGCGTHRRAVAELLRVWGL